MHLPSEALTTAVCPVTCVLAAASLGSATYLAFKTQKDKRPSLDKVVSVASLLLILQSINYPIAPGVSGHVVGAAYATMMLGTPFAILTVSAVLAIQAFLLGDGGIAALGANILNMAVIGCLVGGAIRNKPLAALASISAAALACGLELLPSGNNILLPLLAIHIAIGTTEALFMALVARLPRWAPWLALPIIPFASKLPDGLEATLAGDQIKWFIVALTALSCVILATIISSLKSFSSKPVTN